jgi:hypothetical protein
MSKKPARPVGGGPFRVGFDGKVRSRGQIVCLCKNRATAMQIVAALNKTGGAS